MCMHCVSYITQLDMLGFSSPRKSRADLGRFRIRSRNQRTNLNPNPDLIPDSESCVVESDLESESCRFESESDSDS